MNFEFNIKNKYFNLIKNEIKTIELRLYDKKRKLIKIGDKITFVNDETQEKLFSTVINLYKSSNFINLTKQIKIEQTGFKTIDDLNKTLLEFYSPKKQEKFGVLGIEIKLI